MSEPPISHHHGKSEQKTEKSEASTEQKAQMEQAYQQMQRKLRINKIDQDIKHKIMVLSGMERHLLIPVAFIVSH